MIEWGTWGRDERDARRQGARTPGAGVELHFLDEPLEVLWDEFVSATWSHGSADDHSAAPTLSSTQVSFQRPDARQLTLYDPEGPLTAVVMASGSGDHCLGGRRDVVGDEDAVVVQPDLRDV